MSECYDCKRPYTAASFPDLVIEDWAWKRISPTGDAGGLLCPCCILERLHIEGISCRGAFASGPVASLAYAEMGFVLDRERAAA